MLVGVDFDNTIVCYDVLFHQVAVERGLIPPDIPATKGDVRDYLRRVGKEDLWTELQGCVYGSRMQDAPEFPGVREFFARCREVGVSTCIVSHKTKLPFEGPRYDLHQAAEDWLLSKGFYDPEEIGLQHHEVHFELTKQEKLKRIERNGCTHFIDDLPEFLSEPTFPVGVERILFDPNRNHLTNGTFQRASSWAEIQVQVLR